MFRFDKQKANSNEFELRIDDRRSIIIADLPRFANFTTKVPFEFIIAACRLESVFTAKSGVRFRINSD